MIETLKTVKRNFATLFNKDSKHISYSQCGEDLIINFIFNNLGIINPSYLDIGAHHPTYLSNTYSFYRKGCQGVCVEPDPVLFSKIRSRRRRDICLNIGIGIDENRSANFYVMTSSTLNTFSRAEAEKYQSFNKARIREVVNLPLITINNLIKENFKSYPNFISLDIEGWDFKVIQTFDFQLFRPEVFCIETIEVTEYKSERKVIEIIDFMKHNKYLAFADTYVNTIFVDQEKWVSRH